MNATQRYEALRMAALGERLPLEARSGLMLFLRRGMWAWAQVEAAPRPVPQAAQSARPLSAVDEGQRAVVHLFAAIAMRSMSKRPHERIA